MNSLATVRLIALFALLCGPAFADDQNPVQAKYGTPEAKYATHNGYLSAFDERTRNPRWVLERLDKDSLRHVAHRDTERFEPDLSLPPAVRVDDHDYRGSKLDRGHCAAAGNHLSSQAALDATFLYSNVMPQSPDCNRKIWKRLEEEIRNVAWQEDVAAVFVATCPVWSDAGEGAMRHAVIGPHRVWVPTHCGKAILIERGDKIELRAWLVPNVDCGDLATGHFACSVDRLEAEACLDFWAGLPDEIEAELEAGK